MTWTSDPEPAIRFGAAAIMLVGAAAMDLRTRRVPNSWWLPFLAIALVLDAADATSKARLASLAVALAFCVLMYVFWRMRLFGGADAKGLMVLALLVPYPPSAPHALVPVLDLTLNGTVLMVALPFAFLATNLAAGRWAGAATFLGVPMDLERARQRHVWPLQHATPQGLAWRHWPRIGDSYEQAYRDLSLAGVRSVWVTPKVPLVAFLAVGLAIELAWGNLALVALDWAGLAPATP